MTNDDTLASGEDEFASEDAAEMDAAEEAAPSTFEVELDGEVHSLPAALKGAFLRQADYTRKTQELAEHRRALEAERQALAHHGKALAGASQERLQLAALDHQIAEFEGVDWDSVGAEDTQSAHELWARFQHLGQVRERLAYAVAHHDERATMTAAREAAEEMAKTGETLRTEIEGWSPEVAAKLVDYARAFGVTTEELAQMADARLWKLLHKAWRADQAGQGEAEARSRAIRPAVTVSGGGAGGGGVRDELGTKEWMRRRNEQMARAR